MALSGVAVLALLRPLLLPRQPELPQLPPAMALDEDWQLASDPPAHRRRRSHPVWRPVAVGPTSRLLGPSGQQVLITPLASWSLEAFDPESAVRGMAGLDLSMARSGSGPHLQQRCLTEDGKMAERADELRELLKRKDPKFFSTPYRSIRRMVLPPQPRSKSCLLLTTESADLLSTSPASPSTASPLVFEQLNLEVLWPPTGDE